MPINKLILRPFLFRNRATVFSHLLILTILWPKASIRAEQKILNILTGDVKNAKVADSSHPKGGRVTELVTTIVTHMGYQAKIEYLPWKRAVDLAKNPVNFGFYPPSKNLKGIEDFLVVPFPLYEIEFVALVPTDSKLREVRLSNAKNLRTCELMGAETLKKLGLKVSEVKHPE